MEVCDDLIKYKKESEENGIQGLSELDIIKERTLEVNIRYNNFLFIYIYIVLLNKTYNHNIKKGINCLHAACMGEEGKDTHEGNQALVEKFIGAGPELVHYEGPDG